MPSSPRSSVETAHSPSSPFLHNLSQRIRKGSVASHASSHSSDPPAIASDPTEISDNAQSTRRYLLSVVRNDWEYPITDVSKTAANREPTGYRSREIGVSDLDSDDAAPTSSKKNDPYKFDNPDAVGASIKEKRLKKRRRSEAEMEWNDGLRHWALQRDAWTGAVPHKPTPRTSHTEKNIQRSPVQDPIPLREGSDSTATTDETSQRSQQSWPLPAANTSSSSIEPESYSPITDTGENLLEGPYLPIYPPLLPMSHSLRSRIKPSAYPAIYSKVVIQSLTPNVPIPLTHMTNALVDGWKAEGNWPPSAMAQIGGISKRGKKRDTAFTRWKREQDEKRRLEHQHRQQHGHPGAGQNEQAGHGSRGMRKSISGAIKKVIGLGSEEEEDDEAERDLEALGLKFDSDTAPLDDKKIEEENRLFNRHLLDDGKS